MKASALLIFLSFSAFAERVVLRNPTIQGKPIYSHVLGALNNDTIRNAMAHTACRLAGYPHAALVQQHSYDTIVRTRYLTQPSPVFDPHTVLRNQANANSLGFFFAGHSRPGTSDLNPRAQLSFHNVARVDACAEIAQCRHFDPAEFRLFVSEYSHNMNHPFVRQCLRWARSAQPMVFSEITCETNDTVGLMPEINEFHAQTGNRFRVQTSDTRHAATQIRNPEVTCQNRAALGSISASEMMTCDYDFVGNGVIFRDLNMESFLLLTGRAEIQPKTGPACVQDILTKYAPAVVREEYGIGARLSLFKRPFCVESVSNVQRTANGCTFTAQTRDMLQVAAPLTISLSEADRCDELANCFAHRELSCETANFCPAPGMTPRGAR